MTQLKPTVYLATGGGGNVTIVVGKTSVILVDSKTTEAGGKALLAEIAKITPKPVTTVFLTHSDPDHAGGLVAFPTGVKVIAHEMNKKEQEELIAAGGRGAPSPDRLPSQVTTKTKETMTIDGVKFELYHWAPAHTKGDLVVYLPDEKIVATGDIIQFDRVPGETGQVARRHQSRVAGTDADRRACSRRPGGWATSGHVRRSRVCRADGQKVRYHRPRPQRRRWQHRLPIFF